MSEKVYLRRLSKMQLAVLNGEALGLPLDSSEVAMVLAVMDGNVTYKDLMASTCKSHPTVRRCLHRAYAKSGAVNMAQLVLMMTGVLPCPAALLPVQRIWRRKHYKLDEF